MPHCIPSPPTPHTHLGSRVDGEFQLALLAIVHGEALHQEGGEARTCAATEGVEHQESLQK